MKKMGESNLAEVRNRNVQNQNVGATRTILVVDDEEIVRNFAAAVLRDFGYSVVTGANGREALDIFSTGPHSVEMLFTDIAMPLMDGLELARRVRAWRPTLPVIFTSGDVTAHAIEDAMNEGPSAFIQKPFGVETLTGKVLELFAFAA